MSVNSSLLKLSESEMHESLLYIVTLTRLFIYYCMQALFACLLSLVLSWE